MKEKEKKKRAARTVSPRLTALCCGEAACEMLLARKLLAGIIHETATNEVRKADRPLHGLLQSQLRQAA